MRRRTIDLDDLVTIAMWADESWFTKQAAHNWIARDDTFPAPLVTLTDGRGSLRAFSRKEMNAWLVKTGRRSGPAPVWGTRRRVSA